MLEKPSRRASLDCGDCATRPYCIIGKLSPEAQQSLQPLIRRLSFQRGERLAEEGKTAETAKVVKIGTVLGYRRGLDGQQRPIGIAARGAVFGLFGVFGQPNQSAAVAASSGRMCEIPISALRGAATVDPAVSGEVAAFAVQTVGRIAAWSEGMRMRGVVNQLAYALLLMANAQDQTVVELPTHVALAELLGTTRESVARGLAMLEAEGRILRRDRKKCEVMREALLERVNRDSSNCGGDESDGDSQAA